MVYNFIHEGHLEKYYQLKDRKISPLLGLFAKKNNLSWVSAYLIEHPNQCMVALQGVQCAACVWLIQELAKKYGGLRVSVNTGQGQISLNYGTANEKAIHFLEELQKFGYIPSKPQKTSSKGSTRHLLVRLGLCAGLSMNVMMFSASFYTGMTGINQPTLHHLFQWIGAIIATMVVWIGGGYFITRAWQAFRRGILHYDLPISLGIIMAYGGSLLTFFQHHSDDVYFDSVCIFITLMLLGRFMQERMLEKNKQNIILQPSFLDQQVKTIAQDGHLSNKSLQTIEKNDRLLLPVGSLIPVDCVLEQAFTVELDVSWLTGEPDPVMYPPGKKLPAGAVLLGPHAIAVTAQQSFQDSQLANLLTQVQHEETLPRRWQLVAQYYVWGVLSLCGIGFGLWAYIDSWTKGLSVAIAIAVVTCPCSLGISIPLARTMAYRLLMRYGVFIQKPYTLDRLTNIQHVALDKTGTVTLGRLIWTNPESIQNLSKKLQQILLTAVSQSQHPASRAIYEKLITQHILPLPIQAIENVGQGVQLQYEGQDYFVGRAQTSKDHDPQRAYQVLFYQGQSMLARFTLEETLQDQMQEVIAWLKDKDYQPWLVSGDQQSRIHSVAMKVGIDKAQAMGQALPLDKKNALHQMHGNTLFIGDGLNDQLAMDAAYVSALSMHSQLQRSQQASFYYLSESMGWLPALFNVVKNLQQITRNNLLFLITYNALVIVLALSGLITPLISAIIMPVSSIWVIMRTTMHMKKADMDHMK